MKKYRLLPAIALVWAFALAGILTSCMDDGWDTPDLDGTEFGNQAVSETNLVSIAQLKKQYSAVIATGGLSQFTESMQIKGVVTGNDIQGNIYNEVAVEDGTGSILICIAQGGLFGHLPVGQVILVELKDLYIGGYGEQPEIGTPYTNKNGKTYVSRMPRALWKQHFKLLDKKSVTPEEFDLSKINNESYIDDNCGKLMVVRGVKFQGANGKRTYAPEADKDGSNCVNRALQGISSNRLVVRTSTYADFAAKTLPKGECDITGIFTRYYDTWQILIREESDVVVKE